MAPRVADALVDTLGAHGVQSVYGAPGNGAAIFGTVLGGRA